MKFISWNVNGLRACEGKGFSDIFKEMDADFFCLQETKMQAGQLDLQFEGYQSYWNYAEKKGYSGTAIFTRHTPLSVAYGLGIEEHDHEGRVITLEYEHFYVVTVYTPNSQDGLKRLDYRMTWDDAFRDYVCRLDAKKPVLMCGDMNVAHEEIDLKNPKSNRMNAGFTDQERAKFSDLLAAGFTDTWRARNPDVRDVYSWWSYRFQARQKNAGWRIDYWLISNRLFAQVTDARIHNEVFGSDHCPVESRAKGASCRTCTSCSPDFRLPRTETSSCIPGPGFQLVNRRYYPTHSKLVPILPESYYPYRPIKLFINPSRNEALAPRARLRPRG